MKKIISIILVMMCILTSITTINADEVNASEKTLSFSDVKSTHWFYNNVTEMIELGIVNGYEDGTFRPQGEVKADEFIKMVLVAMGYEPCQSDSTYWADGYITKAEELKIVDKTFINDYRYNLTREQVSRIIVNALSLKETKPVDTYNDYIKTAINDYHLIADKYKQDVIDCYAWGIMQGDTNKNINPKQTITRAETTAVILRMMNKDRRLGLNFEAKQITLFDDYAEDKSSTIIAPIFNGKSLDEIIDVALILQKQLDVSKGGEMLFINDTQEIGYSGCGTQEQLDYILKIGKKSSNEITYEEIYNVAIYTDFTFLIDTLNLSGKYKPYDLSLWKKIIYEELGYATYYDYFIDMYKQPLQEMFKYLFEDEYEKAWGYFVNGLKYDETKVKIEKYVINERYFQIAYDTNGVTFCISLKGQYK